MHKFKKIYEKRFFIVVLVSILICSCSAKKRTQQFSADLRKAALKLAQQDSFPKKDYYTVDQDDMLDITVWKSLSLEEGEEQQEYFINNGDTLEISVWQWPDLLRSVVVRPDGKISFPLVGDIHAKGKSLTELDNEITERLSAFIKAPEVSVMVAAFGLAGRGMSGGISFVKIDELSTQEAIAPDGNIYLPLIGAIQASGLTLNQLGLKIKEKVAQFVQNPEVSITIKQFGGRKLVIMGEVSSPGVYTFTGKATVLEAIGWAGGYTRDAVLKNVLVIRGDLSSPEVFNLNLHNVLKKKDMSQNLAIQPKDIIYIPRTVVSEVSYMLTQLLGPLTSSSSAVTSIKTIRERPSPKK